MYVPHFNALDDEAEIRALVAAVGTADLVTVAADGFPVATLLPVLWEDARLVMHLARANPQWRALADGAPALAVVTGPDAYVSPAWYPSKDEHGRVVPTWNYSQVHLTGRLTLHHDPAWLLDAVTRLTNRHEEHADRPLVGRRRPGAVRREAAEGDRRTGAGRRAGGGEGQAQPEPFRGRPGRRGRRAPQRGRPG